MEGSAAEILAAVRRKQQVHGRQGVSSAGHLLLLLAAFSALLSCSAAADQRVEVKMQFLGLSQTEFDQEYASNTLQAVAASAGVPDSYITRIDQLLPDSSSSSSVAVDTAAAGASSTTISAASSSSSGVSGTTGNSASNGVVPTGAPVAAVPIVAVTEEAASTTAATATEPTASIATSAPVDLPVPTSTVEAAALAAATVAVAPVAAATSSTAATVPTAAVSPAAEQDAATSTATIEVEAAVERPKVFTSKSTNTTVLNSTVESNTSSFKTGARKLLQLPAATAAAAGQAVEAQAIYSIRTSNEDWATATAIREKLRISAAPPGYSFFSNLQRRGVLYEPTVVVDGVLILRGSLALTGRGSNPSDSAIAAAQMSSRRGAGDSKMVGPMPLWVFIPIVILGSVLALLLLAATGVLIWRGCRAFNKCYGDELKQKGEQIGQFIQGSLRGDGNGLVKQPGGGYAPTQCALEKLNAAFPNKSSSPSKGPESIFSNNTIGTYATTARSTAALLQAADGKRPGANGHRAVKNNSSGADADQPVFDHYLRYLQEGKNVPILPHSRIVKPGPASIKVPAVTRSSAAAAAAAAAVATDVPTGTASGPGPRSSARK